jgi:hypothetical protein
MVMAMVKVFYGEVGSLLPAFLENLVNEALKNKK